MQAHHTIRLRAAWQCVMLPQAAPTRNEPAIVRFASPGAARAAAGEAFRGAIVCVRRFHAPSGLEPYERVWLVVPGVSAPAKVRLNLRTIGELAFAAEQAEFDITDWLEPANELAIEIDLLSGLVAMFAEEAVLSENGRGPVAGDVRLEIRARR